jgi:hypothetical protein
MHENINDYRSNRGFFSVDRHRIFPLAAPRSIKPRALPENRAEGAGRTITIALREPTPSTNYEQSGTHNEEVINPPQALGRSALSLSTAPLRFFPGLRAT